jgi:hypothetical protein
MKKTINIIAGLLLTLALSCASTQSLQEYYVDNAENPNFISLDIPASILNLEEVELTDTQREAVSSLRKLNILAFKKTVQNTPDYKLEKENVKAILANSDYTELMKVNTEFGRATVRYLGEEDAIDEVIMYGDNDDKGFALVRVLGKNMNPAHFVQLLQALQKSDFNGQGLGDLGGLFKS